MNLENKKIIKSAYPSLVLLMLLWSIHFLNLNYNLALFKHGIFPRNFNGLQGILFSPLIHSSKDIKHIINNSVPLLILGWTLFFFYKKIAVQIFSYSWLVVGFLVWISARESFHIGMSGVIYSLAFFFFLVVFLEKKKD